MANIFQHQEKTIQEEHIEVVAYNGCSDVVRSEFESWVSSLTPEADRETGGGPQGALSWVKMQNVSCAEGDVYQTYIFIHKATMKVVATGSIVRDDRDVGKSFGIEGAGFWGFLNVHREMRGRGVGKICSGYLDKVCQQHANRLGRDVTFHAFTSNPVSAKILQDLGFIYQRDIFIAIFAATEALYSKTYRPD
jgi:hypothetical protein